MRRLATGTALALALTLAACGGGDDETPADDTATSSAPTSEAPPADAGDDWCEQVNAAGANGTTFGVVAIYDERAVQAAIDDNENFADITPPETIAEDWQTRQDYIAALDTWLQDGGGPAAPPDSEEPDFASQRLTDYWFTNCAE